MRLWTPPTPNQLMRAGAIVPQLPVGLALEASGTINTADISEAVFRASPVFVPMRATFDRISCEVVTLGTAGAVVRLGIYRDTGSGLPGALVLDAGTIDGTQQQVHHKVINQALDPGWYWIGGATQGGALTRPVMRCIVGAFALTGVTLGFGSTNFQRTANFAATGGLPDPSGATTALTGNAPRIAIRRSV